jgi:diguanylate cyclase (GGDEF)-like protein
VTIGSWPRSDGLLTLAAMNLNQNVVLLLAALVAANALLIGAVVVRSYVRRRRLGADAPPPRVDIAQTLSSFRSSPPPDAMAVPGAPTRRTDQLTGLLLPTEWNRIVADEDSRIGRYGRPATIVIIELEGVDRLTGVLGQEAGDRILPAVADTLSRNARGADHLARLGPARFGILLPETGEVEAVNYVERVRSACDLWLESGAIALRLAIGWASPTTESTLADALTLATDRMYMELRRSARRATDLEPEGFPTLQDIEGSPSPA